MKTWKIPVIWSKMGTVNVEADTLDEAIEIAATDDIPLPDNGEYVDCSFEVACEDMDFVRDFYNDGQEDDVKSDLKGSK